MALKNTLKNVWHPPSLNHSLNSSCPVTPACSLAICPGKGNNKLQLRMDGERRRYGVCCARTAATVPEMLLAPKMGWLNFSLLILAIGRSKACMSPPLLLMNTMRMVDTCSSPCKVELC